MKAWLKGGLIGGIISLIMFLIGFPLENIFEGNSGILLILATIFLIINFPGIIIGVLLFGPYPSSDIGIFEMVVVAVIIVAFWFGIGALTGFIIQKIKQRRLKK